MEIEQLTSRFNSGQGVAVAALVGLGMWAVACVGIFAAVTW